MCHNSKQFYGVTLSDNDLDLNQLVSTRPLYVSTYFPTQNGFLKLLSNDVIRDKIFSHLDSTDIKNLMDCDVSVRLYIR